MKQVKIKNCKALVGAIIFCITIFVPAKAQVKASATVAISGSITTVDGKPLVNCYVRVAIANSQQLLAFFNTGDSNRFRITIPFSKPDSIKVTVSYTGYETTSIRKWISDAATVVYYPIIMPVQAHQLDDVTVKAPPIWVRGDTTFFSADAFKEGDERKLKDLIVKMPGFEIDENGNLLYKKKKVDKIMVEGDELFADKVKLLLASFPVHVLANIQVLENQSKDKLLKGLANDKKVYVNLGLNNAKLHTAFGDGEVGIGSENRYLLKPVLFSIYGKVKASFIGNFNSIGEGISWQEETQQENKYGKDLEVGMLHNNPLSIINNFDNSRYLKNQLWDNHLQVNTPYSKKIKVSTEIGFRTDRQVQDINRRSVLYSDSAYFSREEYTSIIQKPKYFTVDHTLEWQIDSTRELKANIAYYGNFSSSLQQSFYLQNTVNDTTQQQLKNHWNTFTGSLTYLHRKSTNTAIKITSLFSTNLYSQTADALSNTWPQLYKLPSTQYNQLLIHPNGNYNLASIQAALFTKIKGRVFTSNITGQWQSYQLNNETFFTAKNANTVVPFTYDTLSNQTAYRRTVLAGSTEGFIKIGNTVINITSNYGMAITAVKKETGYAPENYLHWLYGIGADKDFKIAKKFTASLAANFTQNVPEINELNRVVIANGLGSYHKNVNVNEYLRAGEINGVINYTSFESLLSSTIVIKYRKQLSSFMKLYNYDRFVQYTTDSLVHQPLDNFSISNSSDIPSLWLKTKFSFGCGLSSSKALVNSSNALYTTTNNYYYYFINAKRNWAKKFFVELKTSYNVSQLILPTNIEGQPTASLASFNVELKNRLVIKKKMNWLVIGEFINNNIGSTNKEAPIFILNAECNFPINKKGSAIISIKAANLTDRRGYYISDTNPFNQSITTFQLIPFNVWASIRYQL